MGHYYQQTESGVLPRHFVEMATRPGELRPTRITDVKKWWKAGEVVVPSVTTVLNVLAKPALTNWLIDQHLKQAFDNPQISVEGYDEWLADIKRKAEMEMDKAPSAGSDLHNILEQYYLLTLPMDHELRPLCNEVNGVIEEITDRREWETEVNFVHDGYGGQVDLACEKWLIDFKTKQTADKFKPGKMVYDEHKMQLAAYREGLCRPKARCANVFICLENGEIDFHEHSEADLDKGWQLFKHTLSIWNLQNKA